MYSNSQVLNFAKPHSTPYSFLDNVADKSLVKDDSESAFKNIRPILPKGLGCKLSPVELSGMSSSIWTGQ